MVVLGSLVIKKPRKKEWGEADKEANRKNLNPDNIASTASKKRRI